jgi:hypothetical protein
MAGALAYFKIKVTSFSDSMFENILFHLLDKFHVECEKVLRRELGVNHDDNKQLMRLVADDASLSKKRAKLEHDLARQKEALDLIRDHLHGVW